MSKGRLEAFSDGVIAIAITLLVLDIHVPAPEGTVSLADALGRQWPSYAAYVVSFLTIGVIWINHHAALRRLSSVDHTTLVLNLLLLMCISVLPFTTALLADYLRQDRGEHLAAAIYAASLLLMSLSFLVLQTHTLRSGLVEHGLSGTQTSAVLRRNLAGTSPYALALLGALVTPYLTLAISGAVIVFYALPGTTTDPG